MPVVAAAAAAVFTSAVSFATAAGTALLASVGGAGIAGATIAGIKVATIVGALQIGTTAMSIFSMARKPKAGAASPSPIAFKADPNAFLHYVAGGPVGVGGHQVFAQTSGNKNKYLTYTTALSAGGPVHSVEPFKANDNVVTFDGRNGKAGANVIYVNRMWQKFSLGAVIGAAALTMTDVTGSKDTPGNNNGHPYEWTPQHTLPSIAHTLWTLLSDPDKYPQLPKPLWEVRGGPVYDPRKDSTFPGGNGPQRWSDRNTWSTEGNQNPFLQALTFCIGHTFNGVRLGGVGVPIQMIDVPRFVEGANVADANGWKIAWVWNTGMRKWDVLTTMLQAGAGTPLVRGSKISCMVEAPRVSIGVVTDADIMGPVSITGSANKRDRKNTIIPRCKSSAHKWTVQPFGAVTAATYLAEDKGQERAEEIEYESIADNGDGGQQLRQIAAYDLANMREGLGGVLPLPMRFMKYRAGDCLTVNAPKTLLNGQKVLILKREVDTRAKRVNLTVRSETDGKHDFALGRTADAPPSPNLTGVDPTVVEAPLPDFWLVEPGQDDGMPAIVVRPAFPDPYRPSGAHEDDAAATHVIIRYRRPGLNEETGEPWEWKYEEFPASALQIELRGMAPLTTYEVEAAYRKRGIVGDFRSLGLVTTRELRASDIDLSTPPLQPIVDAVEQVPAIREELFKTVVGLLDEVVERRKTDDNTRRQSIARDEQVSGNVVRLREEVSIQQGDTLALIETTRQAFMDDLTAETSVRQLQVSALNQSVAVIDQLATTTASDLAAETSVRITQISQTNSALAVVDQRSQTTANGLQSFSQTTTTQLADFGSFKTTAQQQLTTLATASSSQATSISLLVTQQAENSSAIQTVQNAVTTETQARSQADLDLKSVFDGGIASANQQITTLSNAQTQQATLINQVQTTANGASATATLAIQALDGNAAYLSFKADVNNRITLFKINGVDRALDFLGDNFNITSVNGGISYGAGTKTFKIYGDGQKTLLKASGPIRMWSGPESIADGDITEDNGVLALGPGVTGGGRFNGLTLTGFFDSGVGGTVALPKNTWTTIASVNRGMASQGVIMSTVNLGVFVQGASGGNNDYGVLYRLAVADADGSNPVEIQSLFGGFVPNQWVDLAGVLLKGNVNLSGRGERRILLQVNPTGENITTAQARNGRVQGIYGA